ncbi:unnamed protein product [Trifolium pratense]|uniref:Uncharacterized protein n=1 Tax=Trifolium pratense TaxID=57577 RepID=A0ACB0KE12_TRIPR|nr:unnamed protein product [Trifolium pratense]
MSHIINSSHHARSSSSSSISYTSDLTSELILLPTEQGKESSKEINGIIIKPMALVGCPKCFMYVMLSEENPKCPKCNTTSFLDIMGSFETKDN